MDKWTYEELRRLGAEIEKLIEVANWHEERLAHLEGLHSLKAKKPTPQEKHGKPDKK